MFASQWAHWWIATTWPLKTQDKKDILFISPKKCIDKVKVKNAHVTENNATPTNVSVTLIPHNKEKKNTNFGNSKVLFTNYLIVFAGCLPILLDRERYGIVCSVFNQCFSNLCIRNCLFRQEPLTRRLRSMQRSHPQLCFFPSPGLT